MKKVAFVPLFVTLMAAPRPSAAGSLGPSNVDPPIVSFQAPATYYPGGRTSAGVSKTAFTDAGKPVPFIPLIACRQYDSRSATPLANNTPRAVTLSGAPCGIPTQASAVALNVTVFSITGALSNGVLKAGNVNPPTTAWINYPPTETQRGNAGVLPVDTNAVLYVQVNQGAGSVDFTVDVFGYYSWYPANQQNTFTLYNNSPGSTMFLVNTSATCVGPCGLYQQTASGTAIEGVSAGGNAGYGVYGISYTSNGVYGLSTAASTAGVLGYNGSSDNGTQGVGGFVNGTGTSFGVQGQISPSSGTGSAGVHGIGANTSLRTSYALLGEGYSNATNAAAVQGVDQTPTNTASTGYTTAGVRGDSSGSIGVLGLSNYLAIAGVRHNGVTGAIATRGYVGYSTYAFYGADGDYGGTGAKFFVEPYPPDASKVIRYISLEGPESGTYFRGKAETQGGLAVIPVPEHFRIVSDPEGMTVHLTPVGRFAQLWIESADLNEIVIRASHDVAFHYIVHGVRRAFKDFTPVTSGNEFMPMTPGETMAEGLPAEIRQRLVSMGIYNPDGTVNRATAARLGWDKVWAAWGVDQK